MTKKVQSKQQKPQKQEKPDLAKELYEDKKSEKTKAITKADWKKLHELVDEAEKLEETLADLEAQQKEYKERRKVILERELPDKMNDLRLETFSTEDGLIVEKEEGVHGSINEKNRPAAMKWLRDNDYADIIKNNITVWFGKGEDKKKQKVKQQLEKIDVNFEEKESVHPQTLKSFIKECRQNGVGLPENIFSLYDFVVCKIKRKKK